MEIVDKLRNMFNTEGSQRRGRLKVGVSFWEGGLSWYHRNCLAAVVEDSLPDKFVRDVTDDLEGGWLKRNDVFALQRNGKKALAMRSLDDMPQEQREHLDQRRDWNREQRAVETVLDLFPSFKYSYSSVLPQACRAGNVNLVVSANGKARVADVARSHSIWLDPVDAPKELYKHRLRINRVINWAYKNNYVPVMMTLTTYHRWNNLDGLIRLLSASWRDLLSSHAGRRRAESVGLRGWVRRLEITINDTPRSSENESESESEKRVNAPSANEKFMKNAHVAASNSGWHPHFHALLIVPRDKLQVLSDSEKEWRKAWVDAVCKRFKEEFGEDVDSSFLPAFKQHGLVFSRAHDERKGDCVPPLREVDTGDYLAKIMGYDPVEVYGGDKELTSATLKDSKIPFDLIRDPNLPAANVDLWCEYAIATKGVQAVKYSMGLEKDINAYFEAHPQANDTYKVRPKETVVASLGRDVYQVFYRNFKLKELYKKIAEGYDALVAWFKEVFVELGVPELCEVPIALPRPPS